MGIIVRQETKNPSARSLQLVNAAISGINPDTSELVDWFEHYAQTSKSRVAFDLDYVFKYIPPAVKILEAGSCPLLLTEAMQKAGYDVTGIDLEPERFQGSIDALKLKVLKCDMETQELPFQDNEFDAIVFNAIFEHMRIDLIFTMKNLFRVLKPGGILLLSTPNLKSFQGIIYFLFFNQCGGREIYAEYEKLAKLGHMGHVREYTVKEVSRFLEKIGFKIKEVIYRGKYFKKSMMEAVLNKLFPRYRRRFTIVATK